MQDRLVFVISPPRSGSTLLQRMLGSHSDIFTHPEPHMITPLAYLGFHDTVDRAPYDHINAAEAIRLFVKGLPRQEEDYLDALRAYTDAMYGRMLEPTGRRYFLDKTPAYALVLGFLARLYPRARYVVLTRHPLAVMSSYANSFFDGDWRAANQFNPVIERYVPAITRFLREKPVAIEQVSYEQLVVDPGAHLARIFGFLDLPNQPEAVNYGQRFKAKKGRGDPISVNEHDRPVSGFVDKWAGELAADAEKLAIAREMIDRLDPQDLKDWGNPREQIFDALAAHGDPATRAKPKQPLVSGFMLQRRVFLALRKDIHNRPHGRLIKKIRYYCDVLLRD